MITHDLTLLIDLQTDCILCFSNSPTYIVMPKFNMLKKALLDTEIRLVSVGAAVYQAITQEAVRNSMVYVAGTQLKQFTSADGDVGRLANRKQLANRKLRSIEKLLWLEMQNLKDYVGYQGLEYEQCIAFQLANSQNGLEEYATINGLTVEQARRELAFEYAEVQNKKMRIYAWHKKFASDITAAQTADELDQIDTNINTQLWRDALI
jgi:hypothetical protein